MRTPRLIAALASAVAVLGALAVPTSAGAAGPATEPGVRVGQSAYIDVSAATLWIDPSDPRPIDRPALADPARLRHWTSSMSLSDKLGLLGRLQTQALYGDRVQVVATQGSWSEVVVPDQPTPTDPRGYPGWLPTDQLATNPAYGRQLARRPFAQVRTRFTHLYADPSLRNAGTGITLATRLPELSKTASAVQVATPSGRPEWLPRKDVDVYADAAAIPHPTGADLVATAEMFVGLPYLWAGTSAYGFDCSGFTHTVYLEHGIVIPRDAGPQRDNGGGTPVAMSDLQPGDLIFYAQPGGTGSVHHVGMYIGDGYEIDAPINTDTVPSGVEVVKVADHRYADEYAGAVRYL